MRKTWLREGSKEKNNKMPFSSLRQALLLFYCVFRDCVCHVESGTGQTDNIMNGFSSSYGIEDI